jgi:hypothetical protein
MQKNILMETLAFKKTACYICSYNSFPLLLFEAVPENPELIVVVRILTE